MATILPLTFTAGILAILFRYCQGQCNGPPMYILPNNSTGSLAFPESNLDPITRTWSNSQYYPVSVSCTWILKAPPLHVIYLEILFFDTEEKFDIVSLYSSEDRKKELFKFSGDIKDVWEVITPDNTLVVDFTSDEFTTYHGFHFAFMYFPQACVAGGATINEPQLIALPPWNLKGALPGPHRPGFEPPSTGRGILLLGEKAPAPLPSWDKMSPYPQGLNCTWHAAVPPTQLIQIDVLQFQTDADDVLQVWKVDGLEMKPILKFWDDQIPRRQIRSSSPLVLNFISRVQEHGTNFGFLLNVTYISRACSSVPQIVTTPRGYIAYPSHNLKGDHWDLEDPIYYGPYSCDWILKAPEGYNINITILYFDTMPYDQLQIADVGVPIFKHGGSPPLEPELLSKSNQLHIRFSSKSETKKTGFLISFSWLLRDCRFELDPTEGELRSPFYPELYESSFQCTWSLTPQQGSMVHILIARLRLDQGDFLHFTNGDKNIVLTSATPPQSDLLEFASTSSIVINFLSDTTNNKGYFLLKYDVFERGSCNFSITSCGWTTLDPLQVWTFMGKERMMMVEENTKMGMQLPRGYRTTLASPLISPTSPNAKMCLRFRYVLTGQDAFKMTVALKEVSSTKQDRDIALLGQNQSTKSLMKMRGAQGKFLLNAAVNFTTSTPFHIFIIYERGYGPHYRVGITDTNVSENSCGSELEDLSSFSCVFRSSFCGWRNTHTDHRNWELGNEGVTALMDEGLGVLWRKKRTKLQEQHADLLSPPVVPKDLGSNACLNMSFQIHSPMVELKLMVLGLDEEETKSSFFRRGMNDEREIWGQGRVASAKILHASVPLNLSSLPAKFRVILRAISVSSKHLPLPSMTHSFDLGISVQNIQIEEGTCSDVFSCNFDDGFCAWRVVSTGNSVWHIKEERNASFAALLSQGTFGDSSQIISPPIERQTRKTLSFRYLIQHTNQCIKIGVMSIRATQFDAWKNTTLKVIWEQCRAKGDHWLYECIDLPPSESNYQVIIGSGTGFENSKVWIDDLQISDGVCGALSAGGVAEERNEGFSWECLPKDSLCGMTQPLPGSWDWAYKHLPPLEEISHEPQPHSDKDPFEVPFATDLSPESEWQFRNPDLEKIPVSKGPEVTPDRMKEKGNAFSIKDVEKDIFLHDSKTGHKKETHGLKCPDGRILNPSYICDGIPDCEDNSDEKDCDCGFEGCSPEEDGEWAPLWIGSCGVAHFMCPSGKACPLEGCPDGGNPCLPRHFICDGHPHCIGGEDEHTCSPDPSVDSHPSLGHGWLGDSPRPLTKTHAEAGTFGKGTGGVGGERFECSGGLLLPRAFFCDGRKDCPLDGLDEVGCLHCGLHDFLCPVSGVCLPKSVVCDGELSIPTCTDEFTCNQCLPGHFACDVCLPSVKVCDGVWDCSDGEDEIRCVTLSPPGFSLKGRSPHTISGATELSSSTRDRGDFFSKCQRYHFMCPDERCLPLSSVCNRQRDCVGGQDEHECADDNREVEFYIGAKPSSVREVDPWSQFPSYLITPVLHHEKGRVGLLSFQYRLDAWLGPSNITLSIEILNGNDTGISVVPWSLWRQTGHKGKQWLSAEVIIPALPDVTFYRLAFLLTGGEISHRSQQIHLSKITYKTLPKEDVEKIGIEWANCEFGNSWCDWSQAYTEQGFSWVHTIASSHGRRTGPITGFSDDLSSGFIFTDSLLGREGDSADLLSPPLQFQKTDQSLCFRFAMFLYGAHVGRLSMHLMQVMSSGHPFTTELFHTAGGRGLSWIPVSITVDDVMLREPSEPFLIVIRATRGNGPEADIALDQISFTDGSCYGNPVLNPQLLLSPLTSASASYIRSLKAGPSLTPYFQNNQSPEDIPLQSGQEGTQNVRENGKTVQADPCSLYDSCHLCVSSSTADCVWCTSTHICRGSLSSEARTCPILHAIHNNATGEIRSGSVWCPRIAPGQKTSIYVAADSTVSLPFAVTNIEISHTTSSWVCIFTLEGQPEKAVEEGFLDDSSKTNKIKGNDFHFDTKAKEGITGDEEEELWRTLKKYALKKKYENRVIKVPGIFEGTVFSSSVIQQNTARVGVGVIKCEDADSLITLPDGKKSAKVRVELRTPGGGLLDNPEDVHLVIFRCEAMATECDSCLHLNASFPCGWCTFRHSCMPRALCSSGLWHPQSSTPSHVCSVQEEIDFIKNLLEAEEEDEDLGQLEEELFGHELGFTSRKKRRFGKRKVKNIMKKSFGKEKRAQQIDEEEGKEETAEEEDTKDKINPKRRDKHENKRKNRRNNSEGKEKATSSEKTSGKGSVRFGKKGRGRGFLKVPMESGVFVARDVWRLHTGRQYYVPVTKKTLLNLGFVRHVTYGRLTAEKSRTVLMDGAWKKAAGFFIDLYEKAGQDPMISIITTSKETFDKMLEQILPE